MIEIFNAVIGLSAAGAVAALAVILLRLAFPRLSKRVVCLMWLFVLLRLVVPFSPTELPVSRAELMDIFSASESVSVSQEAAAHSAAASHSVSTPAVNTAAPAIQPQTAADTTSPAVSAPIAAPKKLPVKNLLALLWATGAGFVLLAAGISYLRMHLRLRTATLCRDNVYQSDRISSPFVFGIVTPKIYIPYSVSDEHIPYILNHERTHILRRDHIVKAAAIIICAVHWFNPLVWVACSLMYRDIESACDERVIREMERAERQSYSTALLSCSIGTRKALCPVGFGDVSVKERITNIMKYNRSNYISAAAAAVVCIAAALLIFALPVGCADSADSIPSASASAETVSHTDTSALLWEADTKNHWHENADGQQTDLAAHTMSDLSDDHICTVCGACVTTYPEGATTVIICNENDDCILYRLYEENGTLAIDNSFEYEYNSDGICIHEKMYEFGSLSSETTYTADTDEDGGTGYYINMLYTYNKDGTTLVEYVDGDANTYREVIYDADGKTLSDLTVKNTRHPNGHRATIEKYNDKGELVELQEFNENDVQTGTKVYRDGKLIEEHIFTIYADENGLEWSYLSKSITYNEDGTKTVTFALPDGTVGAAG